ncbi:MAG: GTP-binding protein TypA [Candidatus Wildermuthbacteria bacterium RIFCSPLOWO2_01_FULL_47_18]|uniref:GTP-binding protein TypA n=1 Tax=Candidatus Wildermuthbacteria bacterium RIFCSPLOWO2_01_FULL_47_18 TaxID=1802460 RepID=A0A1G2RIV0_9BACT|nr:MAG: GTP-binding protein TypA [Candidatus Wildermuthbacteria bacterium RIFCSPLOWO2_01_FULL_47_18]
MEIRNIAIIAHVDHGKTTLTDSLMRQTGVFEVGQSMDTYALEKERGITIYAKNTATFWKGTKINIIDTPGHADFGSEVERVLRSIDCVLLVVDAQEGPMPQTRFVLKKSLELGLKPIVIINKIDKPAADPDKTEAEVLGLFLELGASDEQANFPVIYAISKLGVAWNKLPTNPTSPEGLRGASLDALLDLVLEHVKPSPSHVNVALRAQPFNLAYDNYLGRQAVARIYEGVIKMGQTVYAKNVAGKSSSGKVTKIFSFRGMGRIEEAEAQAGDIVMIAGLPDVYIGDTICESPDQEVLPAISVDEPTIEVYFLPNSSPFAGREGKFLTTRQIRERLERELEVNVGMRVDFSDNEKFKVSARGELSLAILLENMRREGYEVAVSQPRVIIRDIGGIKSEPFEELTIDAPSEFQGIIIEKLGKRATMMTDLKVHNGHARMMFEGPTRGILGYRGAFVIDTKGNGILSSRVVGFKPYAGEIERKQVGSMISMATGKALAFALWNLQERGVIYIEPSTDIYEGQVIGNTSKGDEMTVNPTKGKELSNMRSKGSDEALYLNPAWKLTIERGLEVMGGDEYLEITPGSVRLRKIELTEIERARVRRK